MSGICGINFQDRKKIVRGEELEPMVKALTFHEPKYCDSTIFNRVALGAQGFAGRLAGTAKKINEEFLFGIAFHGNLYNPEDLFDSKEENIDPLRGLLHLYITEGITFVQRLLGDFCLAVWDGREESLYLATDRFRIHPIFYYEDQEKFLFGTRIKSILAYPSSLKVTINPEAIVDLVAMSVIPTPKTVLKEIRKLPAAHYLVYHNGKISVKRYWNASFLHPSDSKEKYLAAEFRLLLNDAVKRSLNVDKDQAKVGTFLSGGVDSTSVTGIMTQITNHPVKSFSIGFSEVKYNEMDYARLAARAFNSEHFEYFVSPQNTLDIIPIIQEVFDEPYGNASAVSAYYCSRMARENSVDTLYAGDGGDELFAGNQRYADQEVFDYYERIPLYIRQKMLDPVVTGVMGNLGLDLFQKGKKYIWRAKIPYDRRITSYEFFNVVPISEFLGFDFAQEVGNDYNPYEVFSRYYFEAPARTNLDRHLYIDWHLTITDNDLLKFKMAEVAGVNRRYPYLDYRIAEFSTKVPSEIKMRGTKLRSFQKKAFSDLLPVEVRNKKKHGWGLPIPGWLRTHRPLYDLMHDLVLSQRSIERGYFKKKALEQLIESHRMDKTGFYGTVLWCLMALELWHRRYWDKSQ